jgi:hypothetical protein
MDAQIRAGALRFWERQVWANGDIVRAAVEALDHFDVWETKAALRRSRPRSLRKPRDASPEWCPGTQMS